MSATRRLPSRLTIVVWLLLTLLAVMAVLTWWQPGAWPAIVGLAAIAPLLYLVAWPCVALAAVRRDVPALAVALALVAIQLAVVLPTMHPWSTAAAPLGPWRLTVYDQNVLDSNPDLAGIGRQIAERSPDVVTLEELSDQNIDSLTGGVLTTYPYHETRVSGSVGFGIWSRVPLTGSFSQTSGHGEFVGSLRPPGQSAISLIVVHTDAPISSADVTSWSSDLAAIAQRVRATPTPLIVVGDFNATMSMRPFRTVLSTGLHDAATSAGEGWRMTWPADRGLLPPLIRIDHLLYSAGLTVTSYRLGDHAGSDHRPLEVTMARS